MGRSLDFAALVERAGLGFRAILLDFQLLAALGVQGRHVVTFTAFGAFQNDSFAHDFNLQRWEISMKNTRDFSRMSLTIPL